MIKISELTVKGADLQTTDLLEISEATADGYTSKSITGEEIINAAQSGLQAELVSGTNIKTINGSSLLGSGDLAITASASWGSITGTLSSQTDLQGALDSKQATLVSGTNIKTINGSSLLGSGDLTISGSNIYNADGTLTGARTLTLGGVALTIAGTTSSRFQANGNLGIGTTTDAGFKLDVNGNARVSGTNIKTINGNSLLGSGDLVIGGGSGSNIYNTDGTLTGARTLTLGGVALTIAGTTSSRFQANGNVGIGTTTDAGFKLDVNGTARVQGALTVASTSNYGITLTRSGTSGISQQIYNSSGTTYLGADSSGGGFLFTGGLPYASFFGNGANRPTQFGTNGAIRMTIFAGGNVAIGTTTDVASAILQASSTTQGFLPPRMTNAQKTAIASPTAGLIVFDTTLNKLCVYTTTWEIITSI